MVIQPCKCHGDMPEIREGDLLYQCEKCKGGYPGPSLNQSTCRSDTTAESMAFYWRCQTEELRKEVAALQETNASLKQQVQTLRDQLHKKAIVVNGGGSQGLTVKIPGPITEIGFLEIHNASVTFEDGGAMKACQAEGSGEAWGKIRFTNAASGLPIPPNLVHGIFNEETQGPHALADILPPVPDDLPEPDIIKKQ